MIQVATRALAAFVAVALPAGAAAQDEARVFAGGLVGVSALSADARSVTTESDAAAVSTPSCWTG